MAKHRKKVSLLSEAGEIEDPIVRRETLAAVHYRAGDTGKLARHVRQFGLKGGGYAADLVADILEGKFKRTRHDGKIEKVHWILNQICFYRDDIQWRRDDPKGYAQFSKNIGTPEFRNLQDIYEYVAEDNGMTLEAVEQIAKRHTLWPNEGQSRLRPPPEEDNDPDLIVP